MLVATRLVYMMTSEGVSSGEKKLAVVTVAINKMTGEYAFADFNVSESDARAEGQWTKSSMAGVSKSSIGVVPRRRGAENAAERLIDTSETHSRGANHLKRRTQTEVPARAWHDKARSLSGSRRRHGAHCPRPFHGPSEAHRARSSIQARIAQNPVHSRASFAILLPMDRGRLKFSVSCGRESLLSLFPATTSAPSTTNLLLNRSLS
jgi:hypothetical protein